MKVCFKQFPSTMFRPIFLLFPLMLLCYTRMPTGYNDFYARHKLWPLGYIVNAYNSTFINNYLKGCFYNYTFYSHVILSCDMFNPNNTNVNCSGSLFASHDDAAIVLVFRGSIGGPEVEEQLQFYNLTNAFPGGGTVHRFYYNGFMILWNAGLRDAFFAAKNAFPSYELWVTGMSLGGALTGFAAPYISQMGYFDKTNIKMISFGEPPVGHGDFADRYPDLVPYSYRVTHRNDIVPHIIPYAAGYRQHKNEIWYNNTMAEGAPYIECDEGESPNCSDSVNSSLWTWNDHSTYFKDAGACQKFTTPPPPTF